MTTTTDIIIVGGGLSGLVTAYTLLQTQAHLSFIILEASSRVGGRVHTVNTDKTVAPVEMGATWVFPQLGGHLTALLQALDISVFPQRQSGRVVMVGSNGERQQYNEPNDASFYRISGGTGAVTSKLRDACPEGSIHYDTPVVQVDTGARQVTTSRGDVFIARHAIVIAAPPQLVATTITFTPTPLPPPLMTVMKSTHTWMSDSAKFAVRYDQPFWRANGFGGQLFGRGTLVAECYDHSDSDDGTYALMGFLNAGIAAQLTPEQRKTTVSTFLAKHFGDDKVVPISYHDVVWGEQQWCAGPNQQRRRGGGGHPSYGHPSFDKPHDNVVFWAGSETSGHAGGYMEGAVARGQYCAAQVIKHHRDHHHDDL